MPYIGPRPPHKPRTRMARVAYVLGRRTVVAPIDVFCCVQETMHQWASTPCTRRCAQATEGARQRPSSHLASPWQPSLACLSTPSTSSTCSPSTSSPSTSSYRMARVDLARATPRLRPLSLVLLAPLQPHAPPPGEQLTREPASITYRPQPSAAAALSRRAHRLRQPPPFSAYPFPSPWWRSSSSSQTCSSCWMLDSGRRRFSRHQPGEANNLLGHGLGILDR